jgi:hypothetical protein
MTSLLPTSKRTILLYGTLTAFLVFSIVYLILPPQLKLSYLIGYPHLAKAEPQGTWVNMTCPQCEFQLEGIVIYTSQHIDAPWRVAFYCRHEDIFWIYDFPGGIGYARWYGPFKAYWKITSTAAISVTIISGVTIVSMIIRDKGSVKRYLH